MSIQLASMRKDLTHRQDKRYFWDMELLVFAHRGEAQSFLKELSFKSHPQFNDLYLGSEAALIITGEGYFNVITSLSRALGILGDEISSIVNLGICAAFDEGIEAGEVHPIRTIYGQDEFKSFQTQNTQARLDIITAKERVLNLELAQNLKCFAPLADREAWAVGFVAKQAGLPIYCYKLISDHVSDAPICEYIKELALDYSSDLLRFYLNLSNPKREEAIENPFMCDDNFYFTVSMEREVTNLIKQLCVKNEWRFEEILNHTEVEKLRDLETTPKKRAQGLRDLLKEMLYPTRTKIIQQLNDFLNESGFRNGELAFDPSLEKVNLNLKSVIKDEKQLLHLSTRLSKIDWKRFEAIMNGELL